MGEDIGAFLRGRVAADKSKIAKAAAVGNDNVDLDHNDNQMNYLGGLDDNATIVGTGTVGEDGLEHSKVGTLGPAQSSEGQKKSSGAPAAPKPKAPVRKAAPSYDDLRAQAQAMYNHAMSQNAMIPAIQPGGGQGLSGSMPAVPNAAEEHGATPAWLEDYMKNGGR